MRKPGSRAVTVSVRKMTRAKANAASNCGEKCVATSFEKRLALFVVIGALIAAQRTAEAVKAEKHFSLTSAAEPSFQL